MKNSLQKLYQRNRQLVLYGLIGVSGATIDYIAFLILYNVLQVNPLLATIVSISLGIINNFVLNRKYNFKVKDRTIYRFLSFYNVGLLGIILSIIIIYALHNVWGLDANLAKLISIPPIVIMQYILNKHISFGAYNEGITKFFKLHLWIIVINVAYIALVGFAIKNITLIYAHGSKPGGSLIAKQPPDEVAHYHFNVEYIAKNNNLPVSGRDDLEAYKNCRDNDFGKVPCLYSYTVYPAVPYIISAIFVKFSSLLNVQPYMAARLPNIFYGLVFLNSLIYATFAITRRKSASLLITFAVAFLPQTIFTLGYLNLDAFSLAVSGLVGASLISFIRSPTRWRSIYLGLTIGGLLSVSKYNYYILLLPSAVLAIYLLRKRLLSRRVVFSAILWAFVGFVLIGAFWFVRNYILYNDILGQKFVLEKMSLYHSLGVSRSLSLHTLSDLGNLDFWNTLFKSFIAGFGSMAYFLDPGAYNVIGFTMLGLVLFILYKSIMAKRTDVVLAILLFALTALAAVVQIVYNSMVYDFQPQGRYLFPALVPFAIMISYVYAKSKDFKDVPAFIALISSYALLLGSDLFIKVYL